MISGISTEYARTNCWGLKLTAENYIDINLLKSAFSSAFLQIQFNEIINYLDLEFSHQTMSSGAEKLKNNKSIAILDAAEQGGYGVVSVVCVRVFPLCNYDISENQQGCRMETSQWMYQCQAGYF